MAIRVIGAGLGRTGTNSLKVALEQLLGAPCYHMFELIERPEDTSSWQAAVDGDPVDWDRVLDGYEAIVDWPGCSFWRELAAANPEAIVLLSTRESAEQWWASMEKTIVVSLGEPVPADDEDRVRRRKMILELMRTRFEPDWGRREAAIAAYERHNQEVRDGIPAERLVEWRTGDGWGPICAALGLPVPAEPFPHTNTAADFRAAQKIDEGS